MNLKMPFLINNDLRILRFMGRTAAGPSGLLAVGCDVRGKVESQSLESAWNFEIPLSKGLCNDALVGMNATLAPGASLRRIAEIVRNAALFGQDAWDGASRPEFDRRGLGVRHTSKNTDAQGHRQTKRDQ